MVILQAVCDKKRKAFEQNAPPGIADVLLYPMQKSPRKIPNMCVMSEEKESVGYV